MRGSENNQCFYSQALSKKVIVEGRAKLHHAWAPEIKPWDLCINGQKLQPLEPEEVVAAIEKPTQSFEEKFVEVTKQQRYHLGFKQEIMVEIDSALDCLCVGEWARIQQANKTYGYANLLATNDPMKNPPGLFPYQWLGR